MDRLERLEGACERAAQLNLRVAQLADCAGELGLDRDRYIQLAEVAAAILAELLAEQTLARAVRN